MDGVHTLGSKNHLQSLGLSSQPSGRAVLPLVLHKRIELDTFILERILYRSIGRGRRRADIAPPRWCTYSESEAHNTLQRRLRARISTYWSRPDAGPAEGLNVLRTLDADVVRRERDLQERSALVLREFGYGFGLSNGHVIQVLRWYTQAAMHYLDQHSRGC